MGYRTTKDNAVEQEQQLPRNARRQAAAQGQDTCVLLLLPTGSDAVLTRNILNEAGFQSEAVRSIDDLCQKITAGAGAVVIAEEALTPPALDSLSNTLAQQPPWSDLPLIILTSRAQTIGAAAAPRWTLDTLGNATFLERPLRVATLLQSVKVALNSRRRQYDSREYLHEREQAAAERLALLERQRSFLRDVLLSVTEGRLLLCDSEADLPARLPLTSEPVSLTVQSLKTLRRRALEAADAQGFPIERKHDFITGVSEAAMNAVVHAGGGTGTVACSPDGTVQVWVEDQGAGIDMDRLPRATLERGFSSAGTLGHGFWLVLKSCDRVYLLTGPSGSTLVLEQDREPPQPGWLD